MNSHRGRKILQNPAYRLHKNWNKFLCSVPAFKDNKYELKYKKRRHYWTDITRLRPDDKGGASAFSTQRNQQTAWKWGEKAEKEVQKVPDLTDNDVQFTNHARNHRAFPHVFDRVCKENRVEHRLTQPAYPWTNGQVERMNKTIKEATVHRYYYESQTALQEHLQAFINAYNFAKRLKSLNDLTPWEFIVKERKSSSKSFRAKLVSCDVGLNI